MSLPLLLSLSAIVSVALPFEFKEKEIKKISTGNIIFPLGGVRVRCVGHVG